MICKNRDVSRVKFLVRPLRLWAESATPGWNRVKVSENLGATAVVPVVPEDKTLMYCFAHKNMKNHPQK